MSKTLRAVTLTPEQIRIIEKRTRDANGNVVIEPLSKEAPSRVRITYAKDGGVLAVETVGV